MSCASTRRMECGEEFEKFEWNCVHPDISVVVELFDNGRSKFDAFRPEKEIKRFFLDNLIFRFRKFFRRMKSHTKQGLIKAFKGFTIIAVCKFNAVTFNINFVSINFHFHASPLDNHRYRPRLRSWSEFEGFQRVLQHLRAELWVKAVGA